MNILFMDADNSETSGAFRSMLVLNDLLNSYDDINTCIVVRKKGKTGKETGEKLLKNFNIEYKLIRSCNWIINIGDEKKIITKIKLFLQGCINSFAIIKIAKLLKKENIDLVHINTTATYVGAMAAKWAGVPVIWHIREFLEEDQNLKIANRQKGYELINQSERIVLISKSLYKKYESIFDKERMVCIFNGIDTKKFYSPEKNIFQTDNVNLLIVGGLYKKKGQMDLCRACKLLCDKGITNFNVKIVGDGEEYQKILEYIKENKLESHISMLGVQQNVEKLYQESDIAFMCSQSEAFGRVTVEAMLSGCLVIGANTAATEELIEHNATGLLYQQGSAEDLAEKIEYAISYKDEMKKIAEAGRDFAVQNMTAEKNAENIYALYKEVLNENK